MNFLLKQKWLFLLFVLLGIFLPQFSNKISFLLFPIVILVTTLNIYDANFHSVSRENIKRIIKLLAINYVLLGGILIVTTFLFVENPAWKLGMILLALAPPAMAIIPLSHLLKADTHDGALAEFIAYVVAVVIVPIVALLAINRGASPFEVIQVVIALVLVPMILSKIMSSRKIKYVEETGNLLYGLVIYILVGLSMPVIAANFVESIPIFVILIVTTFALGGGIYVLLINKHVKEEVDVIYVLFATLKNAAVASVLAIILFEADTIVPLGIREILLPFYIAFLQLIEHNHHMHVRNHKHGHLKHGRLNHK